MKISTVKIVWNYLTGGYGKVADYLLDILNDALKNIDGANKEKVTAVFNLADRVLGTIISLKWLCPTKWQTACDKTIAAVSSVCDALQDFTLTADEVKEMRYNFSAAVGAWKSPDDETCVTVEMLKD